LSVTAEIFFQFTLKILFTHEFIPHDTLSDSYDENPYKWREKLEQAPAKLLNPHRKTFKHQSVFTLEPKYVAGLTDAEGCFSIFFFGADLKLKCEFSITLINLDESIIDSLPGFFQVGLVKKKELCHTFVVQSDWQLYYSVIPFFEQHSLLGIKRRDF